jgi:trehalose synthase
VLPVVPVRPKRVVEYAEPAGEDAVDRLRAAAEPLRGLRVLQVNSTAFGGGVAELLHTHVALLNDLGIETTWAVLEGSDEFFAVTKAAHNALQGAETRLTEEMQAVYRERVWANAAELPPDHDIVLIHDPQPAWMLAAVEERGARAGRWAWRCHIDLSATYRPVWEFFESVVNRYDAAIFTAIDYVQPGVSVPRLALIPPSIDPLSPKNAPLATGTAIGSVAARGIDPARPLVVQVSRFDPWKDPLGVIDVYRLVRTQIPDVQLALVGSLAADDPEGFRYLELTNAHAGGDPDIHLLTNLDGVGDPEVNALQRVADVVVQKSIREGFGLVVAEAMWKGRPVVGSDVGGIRMQIEDGVSGYVVDSVPACADAVVTLLSDRELNDRLGAAGRDRVRERYLCTRELEDHLRLFAELMG